MTNTRSEVSDGTSIFDAVKDALTMLEVVRVYGYEPNRAGFITCPFHSEKTASLKLYERNFHCFGCGAHGSVIDFTAKLLGLDPLGAVKRLNEDFNLRLPLDAAPDPQRLQERRQVAHAKQLFGEWRRKILNQIDAAIRTANLADYGKLTDTEALALVYREPLEAWADVLMHGKLSEQMAIFRDRREVERLCKTITCSMPPRSKTA